MPYIKLLKFDKKMENIIPCKNHLEEYAEHYCEECNEFICPQCALSNNHFYHINKIKSIEQIIKEKIKGIDDIKNFSLYKTTELFQFIINYNSLFIPFDNNYIINSINEQFDTYIGKIIELKLNIINIFSKKFELISQILQSTKSLVLETQQNLLLKILENNGDNNNENEYLNKLNTCLEKIRLNRNPNEIMKFIGEYQDLINNCFKNNDDLNQKYNFYMAYKYLNNISFNFKNNFFDKLIQPCLINSSKQIEELIKKLNIEEKKEFEDFESKIKELHIDTNIKKESNKIKNKNNIDMHIDHIDKINNNNIQFEQKLNMNLNDKKQKNMISD